MDTTNIPGCSGAGASVSAVRYDMDAMIAGQMKKHFIAFDVETTGLSPARDRIVELGAVEFIDGREVRRFSRLVNAGMSVSPAALRVNRITDDMLAATPPEKDVYPEFMRFLGEAVRGKVYLCAHNASFDFGFLENTLKRLEIGAELHYVDTLALCRKNIRGLENYKQDTIEEHFGLVNTQSHRALKACYLIKR